MNSISPPGLTFTPFFRNVTINGRMLDSKNFFYYLRQNPNYLIDSAKTSNAARLLIQQNIPYAAGTLAQSYTDHDDVIGYIYKGRAYTTDEYNELLKNSRIQRLEQQYNKPGQLKLIYDDIGPNETEFQGAVFQGKYYTPAQYKDAKESIEIEINKIKYGDGFQIVS